MTQEGHIRMCYYLYRYGAAPARHHCIIDVVSCVSCTECQGLVQGY